MGLGKENKVTASDINALKNRVKTEMGRRQYATPTSLASYNGNFTTAATAGTKIVSSQFTQTVGYINYIKPTGVSSGKLYALSAAATALSTAEGFAVDANSASCDGGKCQGLCYTNCSSGCRNGCSTGCTGGCKSGCQGSCTATCRSGCDNGCDNNCGYDCYKTCNNNCYAECNYNCYTTCTGNCDTNPTRG